MFNAVSIFVFSLFLASGGAYCPYIITRSEWDAGPNSAEPMAVYPMTHVIVHHSNTPTCLRKEDCASVVKALQKRHRIVNNWLDIGYNFLVGEDGNIYEGVGWHGRGEFAPSFDGKSVHVAVIGDYTSSLPSEKALKALKKFIKCAVSRGSLVEDYRLLGHRQLTTKECPGTKFYRELRGWPRWSSSLN